MTPLATYRQRNCTHYYQSLHRLVSISYLYRCRGVTTADSDPAQSENLQITRGLYENLSSPNDARLDRKIRFVSTPVILLRLVCHRMFRGCKKFHVYYRLDLDFPC